MSLSSKISRIRDVVHQSRKRGLGEAFRAAWNRYRYDHSVSQSLPVVSTTTPYHLQVEPSRVCNLRCRMCEYSYMENKGHVMSLENFRKILAEFPALGSLDLTGIGEPFCNPDFLDMVRHAKERGLYVEFVNNGNLLTEARMDALIEMELDLIMFSIDAATKETHEAIRVHSRFDRVLEAIRTLGEKVGASGRGVPERHMNFTMSLENVDEAPDAVPLAKSVGVSLVAFRYMKVFEGSAYGAEDCIETLGAARLAEIREAILEQSRRHGVRVDLDPLLAGTADQERICKRPWMNAYVDVFGNLYPCCLVTQTNHDITSISLGNLLQTRFVDLWNNGFYQGLRTSMRHPTEIPDLCRGCAMLNKPGARQEQPLIS
jgi:MoaA/NifB/PqqE/SkfB family radical SAM enzyme